MEEKANITMLKAMNAAEHAALDQRQRHLHRPHLRDRQSEIGLHQPVLGLKGSARGGDLRKVWLFCYQLR